MNRHMGLTRVLLVMVMFAGLSLLTGCHPQNANTDQGTDKTGSTPGYLTITGTGVRQQTSYTLEELKNMDEALVGESYSAVNNWPAPKFYVGKGIRLDYLLSKAGIEDGAQTIIVRAGDGYNITFTRQQLEEERFCYPNLLKGSEEGAREVPAILAWEYREGTSDLNKAVSGSLCLLLGQKGLNDAVTSAYVKNVVRIEVLDNPPGQWDAVQAEPASGTIKGGADISLSHPDQDRVKIYYTLDGSTPDEHSPVYNPSTSYFQPELIKPIRIDKSVTIKTIVIGFGKNNSPVAAFEYDVE